MLLLRQENVFTLRQKVVDDPVAAAVNEDNTNEINVEEEADIAIMPHLTFCPIFVDSLYWPIKGFKNKELTFEKYELVQQKTILLKDYPYKGRWRTKWNLYRQNLFQSQVYGQQCFTYVLDESQMRKNVST